MPCQACHLPTAPLIDRRCPFCSVVFSRADSATRHARRCAQRGDRSLQRGKRGRKALSCDACSHSKIYCNARLQVPCEACAARKLECVFSRCCTCSDNNGHRTFITHQSGLSLALRNSDGAASLSFLLDATDDTQDFVTENAVGKEPDAALLGPIRATLPPRHSYLANDELSDFIDPDLLQSFYGQTVNSDRQPEGSELVRAEDADVLSTLLSLRADQDKVAARVAVLRSHLIGHAHDHDLAFDASPFDRIFSAHNVYEFATIFCRKRHYRYPIIHWPTLSLEEVPLPLLLLIVLTGASYSYNSAHEGHHLVDARNLYLVADSFTFEGLRLTLARGNDQEEVVQLCQAALLMYGLNTLVVRDANMQHTALTQRLPALVSTIRTLCLTGTRHTSTDNWELFLQREQIIRLVTWTYCADCLATLTCNNPPRFALLEMTGDLPCDQETWDTDSAIAFDTVRSSRPQLPGRSLKDLMSRLLNDNASRDDVLEHLPIHHLHIVLCAFQPLIFNLHVSLALPSQSVGLLRSLSVWRRLWNKGMQDMTDDHLKWLGVARYVPRVEYLSRRVIEVAVGQDATSSRYLQRIPSSSTRDIHGFLRDFVVDAQIANST